MLALIAILPAIIFFVSCQKENEIAQQKTFSAVNSAGSHAEQPSKKIYVGTIDQLYAVINNDQNEGSTIILAPGIYILNPNYPNGGRLELRHDMSLVGQPGHSEAVIIDASGLPLSSILSSQGRTGIVRVGDGSNSIEWLTLQNDPSHTAIRALIQTDVVTTQVARIRIAHCIIKGSSIGINIINRFGPANGRIVEADIEDNEMMDNTVPLFGAGMQIQNSNGVKDAVIRATLNRNNFHDNRAGMLVFNASSQNSSIEVKSYDDKVERNGLGILFNGGFIESADNPTLNNKVKYDAFATAIRNNAGVPAPPFVLPAGGVFGAGGEAFPPFGLPGTAHHNKLEISFHGCRIEDNIGTAQIMAFGGHSFHPLSTPVGTYNATEVYLDGLSKDVTVNPMPSFPIEAAGTNTVTVYK